MLALLQTTLDTFSAPTNNLTTALAVDALAVIASRYGVDPPVDHVFDSEFFDSAKELTEELHTVTALDGLQPPAKIWGPKLWNLCDKTVAHDISRTPPAQERDGPLAQPASDLAGPSTKAFQAIRGCMLCRS